MCVHVCCEDADQVSPSAGLYDEEMQSYMDSDPMFLGEVNAT